MPGSNIYSMKPEEEVSQAQNSSPNIKKAGKENSATTIPAQTQLSVKPAPKPNLIFNPPHVNDNQQLLNYLNDAAAANAPETEGERKAREKKERLEGIISGIGDAASAVSNLIFTTKYAPNMYKSEKSLSNAAQARFDKAKAERDQRKKDFLTYSMNIDKINDSNRNWHLQLQKFNEIKAQNQFDNDLAELKDKRQRALDDLKERVLKNQIDESGSKAEKAKIDADFAAGRNRAVIRRDNAAAGASDAKAKSYKDKEGRQEYLPLSIGGKLYNFPKENINIQTVASVLSSAGVLNKEEESEYQRYNKRDKEESLNSLLKLLGESSSYPSVKNAITMLGGEEVTKGDKTYNTPVSREEVESYKRH